MKLKITDIQTFTLHDGPGIRTTVFWRDAHLIACGAIIPKRAHKKIFLFLTVRNALCVKPVLRVRIRYILLMIPIESTVIYVTFAENALLLVNSAP